VMALAVILYIFIQPLSAGFFIAGALCSMLAGNIGMRTATSTNAKTTNACTESVEKGLRTAFSAGSVMGLLVVAIGLLGVTLLYLVFNDTGLLFSFGFGASSVALFSRVGGGIYTKAADVGADMVGKVEQRIPEDDPRNPAVIADNVGDNVGDIAGMGADLFESYVDSIIAAMAIAVLISTVYTELPMLVAAAGIFASLAGILFVFVGRGKIEGILNNGMFVSSGMLVLLSYVIVSYLGLSMDVLYCIVSAQSIIRQGRGHR